MDEDGAVAIFESDFSEDGCIEMCWTEADLDEESETVSAAVNLFETDLSADRLNAEAAWIWSSL